MKNISQYIMYLLVAVGVIVFAIALFMGDADDPSTFGYYNPMMTTMYVYSIIALIAAIGAAAYTAILKPENIKQSAIGIGAMVLVFVISYALADDTVPEKFSNTISNTASKWSGTGLIAFYILFVVAIASIVVTGVINLVKK